MIDRFCEVTGANEDVVVTIAAILFDLGLIAMIRPACWIFAKICGLI